MKAILIILVIATYAEGQTKKLQEYHASNNITYHVGDTVRLAMGSAINGDFLYVQVAGFAQSVNQDQNNLPRGFAGRNAIIKKINSVSIQGSDKVYFVVSLGLMTNYYLVIEDAIEKCEVVCKRE